MSSDLSGLHGVFPPSLRWNAEGGALNASAYNAETGERDLNEIELGREATFAMDYATRERGYGLIKVAVYDMRLSPVGSPPPPWPDDDEFKPAIGCWLWSPMHGELRLETNAALFRAAMAAIWDEAKGAKQAAAGLMPVICFANSVEKKIKSVNKTFFAPVIKIIGWVERDKVPGWSERAPTVPLPKALEALPVAPAIEQVEKPVKAKKTAKGKAKPADPNDDIGDILGRDPIPF